MIKKIDIYERAVREAEFLVENNTTIRKTAEHFSVSKTTVYKDLRYKLPEVRFALTDQVNKVLSLNKNERHIRGGKATKRKFK